MKVNTTPCSVGTEQASLEIHSRQDEVRVPPFHPFPQEACKEPGHSRSCSRKIPTLSSSTSLLSQHGSLPHKQPGSGSSCSPPPPALSPPHRPPPTGAVLECQLPLTSALKEVEILNSSSGSRRGNHWSQIACCLATQVETPGSFSGQSCPSLHKQ